MSWLSEIRDEALAVIQRVGEGPLAELGFLLSDTREGNDRARQALAASPLLRGLSADEVLSLVTVAIGADAARVASESGALGDALLEGAQSEDMADLAADSIGFDQFLTARLGAAREALEARGIPMAGVGEDESLRLTDLSKASYEHFVADAVGAEIAEYAR